MSDHPVVEYLSPAQTAEALGVTVRALRIYEQKGLVRPLRSAAGWRAYGPEALARLHQVLTLKRLGLSLAKIAVLMSGRLAELDGVLELQEEILSRRRQEAERGLDLVRSARARLASGETLSLDDLTTLTRETTMKDETPDWAKKMQPIIDKHLNAEEKAAVTAQADAFNQAKIGAEWGDIIAKAKSLVGSDPGAPEALNVARRWRAQVMLSTGGNLSITAKMGEAWRESLASPDVAPTLPFGSDVWAFVSQAMAHLAPIA
ncbi:MAG: MerR family transcriptional regulator [Caulobacteraceae bacterium]